MSENLWGEEGFRDVPEEAETQPQVQVQPAPPPIPAYRPMNIPAEPTTVNPPARPRQQQPSQEEQLLENIDLFPDGDNEDDFEAVLNDANLRIEQGRLYQMVMNHSLFEGLEVDERAIQNVQKEIRKFARERMEVMLGMRRETAVVENLEIDFPFNALEVDVLKKLAYTATKGATASSDRYVPEVKRTTEEIPVTPRRTTLNPIGSAPAKKPAQKLNGKAQTPLKRSRINPTVEQILREEGVSREQIEEDYKPLDKPLHQLTEQEKARRVAETNQRLAQRQTVKSPSALPMATQEQQELLAIQRATQVGAGPGMALLLEKVKNMPAKQ